MSKYISVDSLAAWVEEHSIPLEDLLSPVLEPPNEVDLPEGYVSPHFRQSEFACNHCGEVHPTYPTPPQIVLVWLENIRTHFADQPVVITSGYRCPQHNANVGGATHSKHLLGQAVDFYVLTEYGAKTDTRLVYDYCDELIGNDGGVGYYSNFTHIDCRGSRARW